MSKKGLQELSRRNFLKSTCAFTIGALTTGAALEGIKPNLAEASAPALPWPYATLDVDTVRRRGYENYFIGGCCYATAKALLDTLIETVGTPWDTIPVDMFKFGGGGALSWGTLCGALNGSLAIMDLAAGNDVDSIGNELIGWYTEFPFPSTLHDSYAQIPDQVTTVSKSPLCHQSVSTWCYTTGVTVHSNEKYDRCAKLAGDTAAKTAELLNQWKAGTFSPVYQPSAEFARCFDCHVGPTTKYDNVQGKMNCVTCHDDKTNHHIK